MGAFLEYSNFNHVNIIPKADFEGLVHEVFGVIASNLSKSLGPLGSSATILDGMMTSATKDGYSILKHYNFHNRYKRMIYNLILAPCTRMNNTVGDGTTTVIDLTNSMFERYQEKKFYLDTLYRLPRQFTQTWDEVISDLKERVEKKSRPINSSDYDIIYDIAYVTSNGNKDISKCIADVYSKSSAPTIKQKDSPTNKSYVSEIKGYDFPANLISDAYIRNEDLTAQEKDIMVMIFDHKVETDIFNQVIAPINEVIKAMGHKMLIIAPFYDAYMCDTVVDQYARYEMQKDRYINLVMAQYDLGKIKKHQLNDLATILGAKVINQDLEAGLLDDIMERKNFDSVVQDVLENGQYKFYRLIGNSSEASLSCNTGSIFQVNNLDKNEEYQLVLNHAKKTLEDIISQTDADRNSYGSKIYEARERVSQLEMNNFIYYIGADSALQRQIIWDSVEDVIKCVRSAIKSGVVPGCQLSIIRAADEAINKIFVQNQDPNVDQDNSIIYGKLTNEDKLKVEIYRLICDAVKDVYSHVLHGPEGVGMIKLIPLWQYTNEDGIEDLKKLAINKAGEIINESVNLNAVYDIEKLVYNEEIITSAETDTMVLSAASELVKILISGNQCIFLDSEINDSHTETVQVPV